MADPLDQALSARPAARRRRRLSAVGVRIEYPKQRGPNCWPIRSARVGRAPDGYGAKVRPEAKDGPAPERAVHLRVRARRLPATLLRLWAQYPRIGLAVRTAIAAALSWLIAQLLPMTRPYAYYGPLGAVVAGSIGAVASFREAVRSVGAIVLGAVLAVVADALSAPNVATVAAVVFVGMLLSGWRRLGAMGAWVPTSGVFVLVIGAGDPGRYVATYAGVTALGGIVATTLGFLLPQLPYRPADRAVAAVRLTLVEQLRALADGLEGDGIPNREEWETRREPLRPRLARMRDRLETTTQAQRLNPRALRTRMQLRALARQARALEHTAGLIEDVIDILVTDEHADVASPALGAELRPYVADAMRSLADVLLSMWGGTGDDEASRDGSSAVGRLAQRVHQHGRETDEPSMHAATTIVHDLERILSELRPIAP